MRAKGELTMSWFNQGYDSVQQRAQELEEQNNRVYVPDFFMPADGEAMITFITPEPFTFYQHYHQGSKRYFTCAREGCALCDSGNKSSFSAAYLIIDHRYETWADKKTGEKKERQHTLKIAKFGITTAKAIAALHKKKGLQNFVWEVTKSGSGTKTAYTFLPNTDYPPMVPTEEQMQKKTPSDLIMETLAPRDREYLLKIISGVGRQQQQGWGQQPPMGGYGQQQQWGGQQQPPQQQQWGGQQQQQGWGQQPPQQQQQGWGQQPPQQQPPQQQGWGQQPPQQQPPQGGQGWFGQQGGQKQPDLDMADDSDTINFNE
jgi:hypothetical protein